MKMCIIYEAREGFQPDFDQNETSSVLLRTFSKTYIDIKDLGSGRHSAFIIREFGWLTTLVPLQFVEGTCQTRYLPLQTPLLMLFFWPLWSNCSPVPTPTHLEYLPLEIVSISIALFDLFEPDRKTIVSSIVSVRLQSACRIGCSVPCSISQISSLLKTISSKILTRWLSN